MLTVTLFRKVLSEDATLPMPISDARGTQSIQVRPTDTIEITDTLNDRIASRSLTLVINKSFRFSQMSSERCSVECGEGAPKAW